MSVARGWVRGNVAPTGRTTEGVARRVVVVAAAEAALRVAVADAMKRTTLLASMIVVVHAGAVGG